MQTKATSLIRVRGDAKAALVKAARAAGRTLTEEATRAVLAWTAAGPADGTKKEQHDDQPQRSA
jgi:hypothetical protein